MLLGVYHINGALGSEGGTEGAVPGLSDSHCSPTQRIVGIIEPARGSERFGIIASTS